MHDLRHIANTVLADADRLVREGSESTRLEGSEQPSQKLPVAFINAARRSKARNADETTPKIERAIDRKRGEE